MKKLLALLPIIFAVSCATVPTPAKMKAEIATYTLPAQATSKNTIVYVVRPSQLGALIRFNAFLDDKNKDSNEMGYNRGKNFIYFSVTPGRHKIFSKAENTAEIEINAEAGKEIFIKQNPTWGFIMARNNLELIDETEGKYHVKNSSIGTVIREE